ncbi:hypothetical protein PgNI_11355 [Pyricularia grisea]|uniref:Uncharacterized protein n=1 Tax=Pyricularia grisea TaxID=148305 RepID=A0A6P8APA9_PYRGI|nr:hypothetical protein PgNI_11355 [Pyricularia grisea]TLD03858.1 hypothetical protein PgNI_11355 [Pyricularia grisea]
METRATTTICAVSGIKKGTDGTHQGDACTSCSASCTRVSGQPDCCT